MLLREIGHLFLEYTNFKDNLIEYKCLCFNKNYKNEFDQHLKKQFFNTWKFSNLDINKFISLMQKVFTSMYIWMIGKNLTKLYYLKKKILTVT